MSKILLNMGLFVLFMSSAFALEATELNGFSFVEIGLSTGETRVLPIIERSDLVYENEHFVQTMKVLWMSEEGPYTIAKVSKVKVKFSADAQQKIFPSSLSGETPDGIRFELNDLEPAFYTMELKPAGTVLPMFCKSLDSEEPAIGYRVNSACLSEATN